VLCPVLASVAPKYVWWPGSVQIRWESLQCSPEPSSWVWGRGWGQREDKEERWVKERAGKDGEGGIRRESGRERDRERECMTRLTFHQC